MSKARMKVIEQLLVESSDNEPRKVVEGSVRLFPDNRLDWTEKTRRGYVARCGSLDAERFWALIDGALNPYCQETARVVSSPERK